MISLVSRSYPNSCAVLGQVPSVTCQLVFAFSLEAVVVLWPRAHRPAPYNRRWRSTRRIRSTLPLTSTVGPDNVVVVPGCYSAFEHRWMRGRRSRWNGRPHMQVAGWACPEQSWCWSVAEYCRAASWPCWKARYVDILLIVFYSIMIAIRSYKSCRLEWAIPLIDSGQVAKEDSCSAVPDGRLSSDSRSRESRPGCTLAPLCQSWATAWINIS
jgi:hypothetical protein